MTDQTKELPAIDSTVNRITEPFSISGDGNGTIYEIRFQPLALNSSSVHVAWTISPAAALYKQNHFTLDFGAALDPRELPLKVWWTVVFLCIHSHWNLLRPCRIVLPVTLPVEEIEFWQRLLDSERVTLEKYRGTTDFRRTIEFACAGPPLEEAVLANGGARYATCFSGGKESLLQAALLCELTERPLLVSVYSPLPPLKDQDSPWFGYTMREICKRRSCEHIEVKSDWRGKWNSGFPRTLGYAHAVSEISDTFFYSAVMFALAFAQGIRTCLIAAEFFSHFPSLYYGRVVQDFYFMYDQITLGALDGLFARFGMAYGSLISALSQYQVMALLHTRYPDLGALQISCYSMTDESRRYCNSCEKCLRIAVCMLALGLDPAGIGLDIQSLFPARRTWPRVSHAESGEYAQYAASLINPNAVKKFMPRRTWREQILFRQAKAVRILEDYIAACRPIAQPFYGQHRRSRMKYVNVSLRDALDALYSHYWELDPIDRQADEQAMDRAIAWMTAPLDIKPQ